MARKKKILIAVVAVAALALAGGIVIKTSWPRNVFAASSSDQLCGIAVDPNHDLSVRRGAARELVTRADAADTVPQLLNRLRTTAPGCDPMARNGDLVVASLLLLKAGSGEKALWAATKWLDETESGQFSEERRVYLIIPEDMFFVTNPLRECARQMLVRNLGCDYVYDLAKWRGQIVLRYGHGADGRVDTAPSN